MKITGTFKELLPLELNDDYTMRNFILETDNQYNPLVCITTFGKNTDLIKDIEIGSKVECHINLYSKKYTDRWFNNITLWQIDVIDEDSDKEVVNEEMPF